VGALAGFALTGVQSVSRTMVAQMSPEEKSAEFYGCLLLRGERHRQLAPHYLACWPRRELCGTSDRVWQSLKLKRRGKELGYFQSLLFWPSV